MHLPKTLKKRPSLPKLHVPKIKRSAPTHKAKKIKETKSIEETMRELDRLAAQFDQQKAS